MQGEAREGEGVQGTFVGLYHSTLFNIEAYVSLLSSLVYAFLLLYTFLQSYPRIYADVCVHFYSRILGSVLMFICIFTAVS